MASTNPQANTQFDPATYQGGLTNIPGQSLFATNTPAQIKAAGYTPNTKLSNQSTTVLSSNKTPDIANIKSTTDSLSKTGITTDTNTGITQAANGQAYSPLPTVTGTATNTDGSTTNTYSDGTQKTIQSEAHNPVTSGGYLNGSYYAPGSTKPQLPDGSYGTPSATDPENDKILQNLNTQIAQNDAMTASLIANIQQQYSRLIQQQESSNAGAEAGTNAFLLKAGALQHTQSGSGALQSQINYGISQIADLNSKEQTAILQAQQAGQKNDFQLQDKINQNIIDTRKEKQDAAIKLNDQIVAANKDLADKQFQTQQATTKSLQDIATEAAKNGASPDIISAITGAKTVNDAINAAGDSLQSASGQLGDYLQYKRDTTGKGLTPLDYGTWKTQDDAAQAKIKASEAYATSYASAAGRLSAETKAGGGAAYNGTTQKQQQQLEQQYRQILAKEFSARTGALGVENAKVNQANHLDALFQQYYDPKTGNYNIPQSQYAEIAIGLANLVSSGGQATEGTISSIMQATAKGDLNKAITYATGVPQNGSTQAVFKNLLDSVDRQATVATSNRQAALGDMKALAPTDLDPARIEQLNQATKMVPYSGEDRIYKPKVDDYVKANLGLKFHNGQDVQQTIAKAYATPGMTNQDVWDYIQLLNSK